MPFYEANKNSLKQKKIPSFKVQGDPDGKYIGFTGSKQPFRTKKEASNDGSILYFLMDTRFIKMHTSQCFSGIPTTRGHSVSKLNKEEQNLIIGYAIAQSLANKYPIQFNQFDMWVPKGSDGQMETFLELAAAFLFARNGCIECEIPANHPFEGSNRVYVNNPLAPSSGNYYWKYLRPLINKSKEPLVGELGKITTNLYEVWRAWIEKNHKYRARSSFSIYDHDPNKVPVDNWGICQIESELKFIDDKELSKANENRKKTLIEISNQIKKFLDKLDYWSQ